VPAQVVEDAELVLVLCDVVRQILQYLDHHLGTFYTPSNQSVKL